MRIETTRIEVSTDEGISIADITAEVAEFVRATGILEGLCVMTVGRQECFLSLAPELDDAFDDLMRLIREGSVQITVATPLSDRADTDTVSNSAPGFLAESISFAVRDGGPDLGSWEAVVLVDAAGPARRAVELTIMGSARTSAKT
jgi:thiamine phosphate synthase YjbQ (UPF0047 family)